MPAYLLGSGVRTASSASTTRVRALADSLVLGPRGQSSSVTSTIAPLTKGLEALRVRDVDR